MMPRESMRVDFHVFVESLMNVLEARDEYTCGHSYMVAEIAREIAILSGLDDSCVRSIHIAGHFHDIGKIGIPDGILLKTGRLTREEYILIQQHSLIGYTIVKHVPGLSQMADMVKHHHERVDGKGYPDGLAGSEIPFGAAILAVADSFAAMTTTRTYRCSFSVSDTVHEIELCAGTQFDTHAADALSSLHRANPAFFEELIGNAGGNETRRSTSFVSMKNPLHQEREFHEIC